MARDTTFVPQNYRSDQGDLWRIDGELAIGETGFLSFYDEDITGARGRALARNVAAALTIINSATLLSAMGGSAPPVLPSGYATLMINIAANSVTEASARLFSAIPGQRLFVKMLVGAGQSAILTIYASTAGLSGVKIYGSTGSEISSIQITQSAASCGWVHLIGVDDSCWAVVGGKLLTERLE